MPVRGIIDLVGNSGHQSSEGNQFFRTDQLGLHLLNFARPFCNFRLKIFPPFLQFHPGAFETGSHLVEGIGKFAHLIAGHILHLGVQIAPGNSFGLRQKFLYGEIHQAMGKDRDGQGNGQQQKNRQKNDFIAIMFLSAYACFPGKR